MILGNSFTVNRFLFIVVLSSAMLFSSSFAQDLSNYSLKQISGVKDTVILDTLSIVPRSFSIRSLNGELVEAANYHMDFVHAKLIWICDSDERQDIYVVEYRKMPLLLSAPVFLKSTAIFETDLTGKKNPFVYTHKEKNEDIFSLGTVRKSGSIARGISFGNSQDVIVNSSLDLRLSGKVSDDVRILAAITDDNIPIQPDGNTQQIQEFDKVFIKLFTNRTSLIAGDFEIQPYQGYFMRFFKKVQGVQFDNKFNQNVDPIVADKSTYSRIVGSAALSKGKFGRNVFNGIEGNQGPYKLLGSEKESYIIVISGTEKVYIDGKLLERGQDYDYTIDYNTAELSFTPNQLITKDKRIVIEFQYSDRNYARSILHAQASHYAKRAEFHVNVYSEQDAKEQPIDQELSQEQKELLSSIGDNLDSAVSIKIDSVGLSDIGVLYRKIDTLGIEVFEYSPDSGVYRIAFSFVGVGKGSYIQDISALANGRVFKWVGADNSGLLQGSYDPISLLVTPKQKQMISFGGACSLSQTTDFQAELALSNNDLNTFSELDSDDDFGYAIKLKLNNRTQLNNSSVTPWVLHSNITYEQRQKTFSIIERYRSAEFERNWNLNEQIGMEDEYIPGVSFALKKEKVGFIQYDYKSFLKGSEYKAVRNSLNTNLKKKGTGLVFSGSLVESETQNTDSRFIRSKGRFSQQYKWLVIGLVEEQENNIRRDISTDSLNSFSYDFVEIGGFVKTADTMKNNFGLTYKQRTDYKPFNNQLKAASLGESIEFDYGLTGNPSSRLQGKVIYRKLSIYDSDLISTKPDESLISRVEYRLRILKGAISSSTFYQLGSGMEVKKEFSYVKVVDGQGVYQWIDRDLNGIETLDEFEIAAFQYNANYIKVNVPTNQYLKTYSTSFNESLLLRPAILWRTSSGWKKIAARFSNQSTYRIERKTAGESFEDAANPFISTTLDSSLVSLNSSFRNVLFFNRSNPVFGVDLKYLESKGKLLMVNGLDIREQVLRSIYFRYNATRQVTLNMSLLEGEKRINSEFFSSRNYEVFYNEVGPQITYQPNTSYRISLGYNYKKKQNALFDLKLDSLGDTTAFSGGEVAIHHNLGIEFKKNFLAKGTFLLRANYIEISYLDNKGLDAVQNTSLGFEMLEGLQSGSNITWNISIQRTLKEHMQLSITYDGKASKEGPVAHRGGVQLRAFF